MTWSPLTSFRVLEFLPQDTWTEIILISLEPNENGVYIATTEDKKTKRIEDMNKISIQSCFFEKVKEFKALEIVAVKIDDNWHRGKMICYNEFQFHDTKIELIDVGCFYQTKLDNLFILPYYFLYEQLALPIQFLSFIPKTTKLTIKPDLSKSKLFEGVVLVDIFCNNIKPKNNENGKNQFDTKNEVINSPLSSNLSTSDDIVISKKSITYNPAKQEKQKIIALKNGDYCFIQFFQDLSNIYVWKVIKNIANNGYTICNVDNVLLRTISKDQKLKKYPMVGDIVKVFSSLKKCYFRAKILKKNNDISYDVFYIDYGNVETIMFNEVYELSQELCKPGLAIKVGISNLILVKNNSMEIHEKIKKLFEIFIKTKKLFQIEFNETSENHLQNVKFKEIENGFYINDFVMNCLKESESPEVEYKKPLNTNFTTNNDHDHDNNFRKKLNNNDVVYLRSFQSDSMVYVIKDLKLYNEVILNTTQEKSAVLKRDLIAGDIVKVISENCTYRAKIKCIFRTDNIMVSVVNIDTGVHCYVSSKSIYELSEDLIKIPGLSIRLKVDGLFIKNARLTDLLTLYIKSIENIPLFVEYVENDLTKYQTVHLKRTDNSENIFAEFYKIAKCKSSFMCNEISNYNIDDEVINGPKENLKIEEFKNVKLKNGDCYIISFFKDFKNIYVCKAVKDCNDSFYTNHDMDSLLNPINHNKDCEVNAKPVLGDVVKVLSTTYNNFYRAKILSAESENCFRVSYIDYGDIEIAELCNIFELSDNLKKMPGNAIQIGIDISHDKIPNEEIIKMFDHLATQEIQLSIEYNESDKKGLENCVLKVISSGQNINNEVLKLLSNQSPSSLLKIK